MPDLPPSPSPQPARPQRQPQLSFWLSLLLVILCAWLVLRYEIRSAPFHGDESNWIASGYYYTDLLLARDLSWDKWDCPSCGSWGGLNLHLGQWLIGLPLKAYSAQTQDGQEFGQYYAFSEPLEANLAQSRVPPEEMWLFARNTSIVFGVLTCAVAFAAGFLMAGLLAGWLFVGLLLANPAFVASATRAMTDVHYNFFLVCFLLAATWWMMRPRASRRATLACGLLAGLACSVKVTGFAVAGLAFTLLVAYGLLLRRYRFRNALGYLALFAVVAVAVVYLLNPYFWPAFTGLKLGAVQAELRQFIAAVPQQGLPSPASLRTDYPQVARLARPLGFPLLALRWNEHLSGMAAIGLWKTNNRLLELHQSLASFQSSVPWLWLLVPIGLAYCAIRVWRAFKDQQSSLLAVPVAYFLSNYLLIVAFLKQNWDRFYVPTVVAGCLLMAIALGAGAEAIAHTVRRRWPNSAALGSGLLRLTPWALVVALVALNLMHVRALGANDGGYISYRVARNLAQGLGPVYNLGERVLSFTTPGYVLLLAAASVVGRNLDTIGLALNGLALLAIGGLLIDLSSRQVHERKKSDFSLHQTSRSSSDADATISAPAGLENRSSSDAPFTLAAIVAVAIFFTFGTLSEALRMETPLYLAAMLATFSAYRRALQAGADHRREQRWLLWTAAAAAATFWLRMDGVLVGAAIGLHWLITRRRIPWAALGLGLLLTLPWILFAWAYYGSPVPTTLAARMRQVAGPDALHWGQGLWDAVRSWVGVQPLAAILAAIGLLAALWPRRSARARSPMLLWAAIYIAIYLVLDVRSYIWYYVPLAPVIALLAGDGAAEIVSRAVDWLLRTGRMDARHDALVPGLLSVLVLVLALLPAAAAASGLAEPLVLRRREAAYRQTGEALQALCRARPDLLVGLGDAGAMGYFSGCRAVDYVGLLHQDVAALRAEPVEKAAWAIDHYRPDLVVLAGGDNYPAQLEDAAWFQQRYVPLETIQVEGFRSVIFTQPGNTAQDRP